MKISKIYAFFAILTILFVPAKAFGDGQKFVNSKTVPIPKILALRETKAIKETGTVSKNSQNVQNIKLDVKTVDKPSIKVSAPPKKIEGEIFVSDQEKTKNAFEIQKKIDIDDITTLWESTVERNAVIKFALKKLAMPPEQRRIHSSIMAKSVSALISGASILPNFLGADGFTSSASMAGGSLANRVVNSKAFPKELPLTDTELIQLASLVDDLQDKLIKSYYDYKSEIEALKVCRQNLLLQNKNYSEAIKSNNQLNIIAASALYDKELMNELKHKQLIKQYRLELERLAGAEAVDKLNLTKLTSYNYKGINSQIKKNDKPDTDKPVAVSNNKDANK